MEMDPVEATVEATAGAGATVEAAVGNGATLGLEVPVLSSLPRRNNSPLAKCGCKKHALDLYGNHNSTCTAHSGATKAHDWMVGVPGPLFARPDTQSARSTA
jgi:hypothetical protein